MKQNVKLNTFSGMLSAVCLLTLMFVLYHRRGEFLIYFLCVMAVSMLLTLFYMPLSISSDGEELCINRSLRIKRIPLAEIESVDMFRPAVAERRICGSGGWFGYWGWFSNPSLGKYFAYYGKADNCFIVNLKNGRKYLLGCENAPEMVDFIKKHLKN